MIPFVVLIDCIQSPPADAMRAAGVTGLSRYLSWADGRDTLGKVIHQQEFDRLHAAEFDLVLNWEYSATDWLGGASAGQSHGTEAVRQSRALGYPTGCAIYGSADFDITLSQWNSAGRAYAQAYSAAVRGGGYLAGVYGPWDALTWCRDTGWFGVFWQAGLATAWSAGRNAQLWPGAHLRQRRTGTIGGIDVDFNDIIQAGYGQYRGGSSMAGEYSPDTARAIAVGATSAGYVQFTDPVWDDELATYNLKAVEARITAAVHNVTVPVTMTEADRKAIADLVIAGLPKPATAAEIADELARRLQS
jgi:hypothetical protein